MPGELDDKRDCLELIQWWCCCRSHRQNQSPNSARFLLLGVAWQIIPQNKKKAKWGKDKRKKKKNSFSASLSYQFVSSAPDPRRRYERSKRTYVRNFLLRLKNEFLPIAYLSEEEEETYACKRCHVCTYTKKEKSASSSKRNFFSPMYARESLFETIWRRKTEPLQDVQL